MKPLIVLLVVASMLAGAAHVSLQRNDSEVETSHESVAVVSRRSANDPSRSALERLEESAKVAVTTRRSLGNVELKDGRRIELFTAETRDGKACLIDNDPRFGASAGCLDGRLFRTRKVEFSVRFDGGPERFDELYVTGIVAPNIRAAELTKTDGTAVPLELNAMRAFVYQSPNVDLESRSYPNGFRLFGPSGRLAETVTFPPVGN